MSIDTTKLLSDALSLPAEARGALATKLIESLDETVDPDAEALWAEEIHRRLKEIDEGQVQAIPWTEDRASILRRQCPALRLRSTQRPARNCGTPTDGTSNGVPRRR